VAPTADETRRQIEGLRHEVTEILNELEARGRRAANIPGTLRGRVADSARRTAETNPLALALLGLAVVLAFVGLLFRIRRRAQARRRPVAVLRRRARAAAEDLSDYWERARGSLPINVQVRAGTGEPGVQGGYEEPSMVKKLLWMGLTSALMAVAGLVARRLSSAIWQGAMRENPPTAKV